MSETISPEKVERALMKLYGNAGPEQLDEMFSDLRVKFEQRTRELIPEANDIAEVRIGYVEGTARNKVYVTLLSPTDDKKGIEIKRIFCKRDVATKHGKIEIQLPVALVRYNTREASKYQMSLIPWDTDTFEGYTSLIPKMSDETAD